MGRVKLKIKRLESTSNRQVTYSKRRHGILKKARELAILCGIDLVLLMFSPTGRPTLCQGEQRNFEEVIAKFAQLTLQERTKRKLESLEELSNQLRELQAQLTGVQKRLSYWSDPDKINNVEHLRQMEDLLRESFNRLRLHKEKLGQQQLTSLESTTQFQSGMPLSMTMSGVPEAQSVSWLPNDDNRRMILPNQPSFLSHSHRDVECSSDVLLPDYYFNTVKQTEVGNTVQVANMGSGGGASEELSRTACLSVQLGEQYAYPLYDGSTLPDDKKMKPEMETNFQANPMDYQVNSNFDLPRLLYENGHHSWFSSSGPCGIAIYNQNTYQCNQIDSHESH